MAGATTDPDLALPICEVLGGLPMHRLWLSSTLRVLSSVGMIAFLTPAAHAVGTLAGTQIPCWSTATYTDEQGVLQGQASSNTLVMTVSKMRDVVVTPPSKNGEATVGSFSAMPVEIKNLSNSTETFALTVSGPSGWSCRAFSDDSGDGELQSDETTEVTTTPAMAPDSVMKVLVRVDVPADGATGVTGTVVLRIRALGDGPPAQASAVYNLKTVQSLPTVTLTTVPSTPVLGTQYTLVARANPAKAVQLNIRTLSPDGVPGNYSLSTDAFGRGFLTLNADCSGIWSIAARHANASVNAPDAATLALNCQPITYTTSGSDMVSVPVQLTNNSAGDVFGPSTGLAVTRWVPSEARYATYVAYRNYVNDPGLQTVSPGQAFFTYTPTSSSIAPQGRLVDQSAPFSVDLQRGWNQIGSPFLKAIPWAGCRVEYNGKSYSMSEARSNSLMLDYAWAGSKTGVLFDYGLVHPQLGDAKSTLEPWQGYWVYAYRPVKLTMSPTVTAVTAPRLSTNEWIIKLMGMGPKAIDSSNFMGVCANKSVQDVVNPPRATEYEDLYFPAADGGAGRFATDIRSSITGVANWTFEVASSEGTQLHNVTWYGAESVPTGYTITLKDLQTGRTTDMRSTMRYIYKPLAPDKPYRFQVTVDTRKR